VDDLIGRLTLDEKVSMMIERGSAAERLGIPAFPWWNEGLHGVARAGRATVFPQAIGLAATRDTDLMHRVATAISDEARAMNNRAIERGQHHLYQGLTFWSPNINIFRDPRWGRGQETYGEDPSLTGAMAVAFIKGMQGDDPHYLKTIATPKHYAVHSGPEPDRHTFDARPSEFDLRDTYLPAFRAAIVEGKAGSVMCAYNSFRGLPACASDELLGKILRGEWGFKGYVTSDCGAVDDIYQTHKLVKTPEEAAIMALKAGTDLECAGGSWSPGSPDSFLTLADSVRAGRIKEELVDTALRRLITAQMRLGI
jgi:beta-glucosidase